MSPNVSGLPTTNRQADLPSEHLLCCTTFRKHLPDKVRIARLVKLAPPVIETEECFANTEFKDL
jgi:hypothetical protein